MPAQPTPTLDQIRQSLAAVQATFARLTAPSGDPLDDIATGDPDDTRDRAFDAGYAAGISDALRMVGQALDGLAGDGPAPT